MLMPCRRLGGAIKAENGDSTHLLDRMDKYYKDLWKGAK